jgi:hypothetical protein
MKSGRGHQQFRGRQPRGRHPVARRVAMASMSVLAASGIGLVAAPMAFGQIVIPIGGPLLGSSQGATVSNSGSASANTGGNTAIGNASTNTATATSPAGGLVNVPVSVGAPTNTSQGTANVTTGPATAVGNSSGTGVGQSNASGTQVNSFLGGQNQSAGVANVGSGSANSGGNGALGNGSNNTATVSQDVNGGLVGVGVTLGGPTNNSTGTATITSGAANAAGNSAGNSVGQTNSGGQINSGGLPVAGVGALGGLGGPGIGGSGIGVGPCPAGRFTSFQDTNVVNRGQAEANTGNNTAIGNASQNNASANAAGGGQTVSGGLLGVGLTIGGPVNNSSGSAVINTGPATAVGNNSSTDVSQAQFGGCPQVVTVAGGRQSVVVVPARVQTVQQTTTLARTGLDTGDLGMIAGALLAAGMLLVASQRRRFTARHAAVPLAGFGLGLGADK